MGLDPRTRHMTWPWVQRTARNTGLRIMTADSYAAWSAAEAAKRALVDWPRIDDAYTEDEGRDRREIMREFQVARSLDRYGAPPRRVFFF